MGNVSASLFSVDFSDYEMFQKMPWAQLREGSFRLCLFSIFLIGDQPRPRDTFFSAIQISLENAE
jgi:hypothetical protein